MSEIFINIELPKSWSWAKSKEIGIVINGDRGKNYPSRQHYIKSGIPFLSAGNLDEGKIDKSSLNYISLEKYNELNNGKLQSGDIIYCLRGTLGKCAAYDLEGNAAIASSLAILRPSELINKKYLLYFLQGPFGIKLIKHFDNGTAQPNLSGESFSNYDFPIAPFPEQLCIVSKIEELLSSLDKGIESIKTAEQQLEIYRQAVLGKAFEGAFTANWRKLNPNENAIAEFETIKAEREELYTKKIEEWILACEESTVKNTKKPSKPKKPYAGASITDEEKADLEVIDKSWALIRFIDLIKYEEDAIKRGPFGSAIKKSFFVPSGYKVYEQQHAISDDANLGKYYISEEKYLELIGFSVKPGDYILSCSGTIGRISKLPENCEPGLINQALMKIRLDEELISSKYFLYLFRSEVFQRRILKGNRGTGMQNLAGIDEIKELIIALPPKAEQEAIVLDIESRLSVCDKIEESITHSLLQSEALRQSILKKAFEGKLVAQDPNDEPAAVLLERIKAEREKNKPVKKVKENKVKQTKSKKTVTA